MNNKLLVHITCLLSILFCTETSAQWVHTNGPQGGHIYSLAAAQDGAMLAGTASGLYRIGMYDEVWRYVRIAGWDGAIYSLTVHPNGSVFMGTDGSGVFRSQDHGSTWSSAAEGLAHYRITSFCADGAGILYTGTFSGGVYRSTDAGGSWAQCNNGITDLNEARALAVSPPGTVFAGTADGVFRTTDHGDHWTRVDSGFTYHRTDAIAVDSSGSIFVAVTGDGIYRSTDDGIVWTRHPYAPGEGSIQVLAVAGGGKLFGGTLNGLRQSTNAGDSWLPTALDSVSVRSLAFGENGHLYAGTDGEGIYVSTNLGTTWSANNDSLRATFVTALLAADNRTLFAGTFTDVCRSTNGGGLWNPTDLKVPISWVSSLAQAANGDIYAAAFSGGILKTTDRGDHWQRVYSTFSEMINCLALDTNDCLLASLISGGILKSTNGGSSWSTLSSGLPSNSIRTVAVDTRNHYYAGTDSGMYKSTDAGISWNPIKTGFPNVIVSCLAIDAPGSVFAGTWGKGVIRTTDGGSHWIPVGADNRSVYSMTFNSKKDLFVGTSAGEIYRSTDHGASWDLRITGLAERTVGALAADIDDYVYAGTFGEGVFKSSAVTGVTPITGARTAGRFALGQNYPNPFNPATTIRFELPAAGRVRIGLFNILGEEVMGILDESRPAGNHEVRVDASRLPSGIYFYRLTTGTYSSTRKMLLMR